MSLWVACRCPALRKMEIDAVVFAAVTPTLIPLVNAWPVEELPVST